jgi:hypothetical protein
LAPVTFRTLPSFWGIPARCSQRSNLNYPDARDLASGALEQGGITVNDNNDLMRGLMTHQGHRCINIIPAIERVRTN